MQNILEWLWLEACHCTEATSAEDCPAHKKVEIVRKYIRTLESKVKILEGEKERMMAENERDANHGPDGVFYVGGPGEPYYKPFIRCLCGWHTVNGSPRTWEEAGAEFDEHLVETGRKS